MVIKKEVTFNKFNLYQSRNRNLNLKDWLRILTQGFYLEMVLVLKNTSNVCTMQQCGAFV
jgi:hypothetical protein